jgi:CheY-like chemotaxis protein
MLSNQPLRVLIVEDESLLSMMIEDILRDLGWEVPANVSSVSAALLALQRGEFDLALLDVNIAGEDVFPVVDVLSERNVPVVFITGYGARGIREDLRHHLILEKPFTLDQLTRMMLIAADRCNSMRAEIDA